MSITLNDAPNEFADEIEKDNPGIRVVRCFDSTEREMLDVSMRAFLTLKKMGWRETIYCPRNGAPFEFIENGSTGIHVGHRDEEGRFWLHEGGDLWPSHPYLFREVKS